MEPRTDIIGFYQGLRPIERITVSQWADKYRFLSPVSSAEPGRYRTSRTPYLRAIMDCLSVHDTHKKIVFVKAAQIGGTESGTNFLGYCMHIAPAPTMFVQPTDEMVKRLSKGRIDPLIEMCPELQQRVAPSKSRDSNNTITQKSFNGGVLILAGANSAAGLRSVPIRNLVLDEVDAYPQDLDGEGSPIDLATARTRTFPNHKIFMLSTPTIEGASAIAREFAETDQNFYHVPCPHCGGMQPLVFANLKWDEGKPDTVKYKCTHCGELIAERHKVEMLANGLWVPSKPERVNPDVIGFHLNSLYSPYGWHSWKQIVRDFLAAKENQSKLKVFVNTTLGETWAERGEAPPYKNLYNRREQYKINEVPADVCFLTAGVDVQRDRLELEIVGWCADKRSYSIDFRVLDGDTAATKVWNKLADVLAERWPRKDGMEFPIRLMAVDTGYNTTHVYNFCRRYGADRVVPIKGQDHLGMAVSPPKSVDVTKAGKKVGKLRLWNIGVSFMKGELYAALRLEKDSDGTPPPNYCHFPEYDEHYFRGLTAEEQVKRIVRGYAKFQWVKRYERNEPLDCRIYARSAAVIIGLDRLTPKRLAAMGGAVAKKREPRNSESNGRSRDYNDFWG
ncbi:phage terminase large subunit family protein [uncultured Alistipes sp.]|uniref:phage terminase large subunit family protein n=1 Tax=uncultured Alistipes sp. TaxID=538949 RepID=UPI00262E571E|nr:phage terminase large subunit family protein [uncultured Alistipes sp.]